MHLRRLALAFTLFLGVLLVGPVVTEAASAQGPRLTRSGMSYQTALPTHFRAMAPPAGIPRAGSQWKKGALIGFLIGMLPGLLLDSGGEECDTSAYIGAVCGTAKAANIVVGGILGAVIGGYIGSRSSR